MIIPEYIIVMTWILAAVIIVAIIAAIFFRLYIMFLSNEKENLRDKEIKCMNMVIKLILIKILYIALNEK